MASLDSAFMDCHTPEKDIQDEWGRRFFAEMEKYSSPWAGRKTEIYMAASQILYDFAFREDACELASSIYHNPESLLRMIVLMDQGRCL